MAKLPWYKMDHGAFVKSTMDMRGELKTFYCLLICLIYANDGKLHRNEKHLAGLVGYDVRVVRRLLAELIEAGRIYLDDAFIRNRRCDREIASALAGLELKKRAGKASGQARQKPKPEPSDDNGLDGTGVRTVFERCSNDKEGEIPSPSGEGGAGAASGDRPAGDTPTGTLETDVYRRGKAMLGAKAGGMITRAKEEFGLGVVAEVVVAMERESPESPREFFEGALRKRRTKAAAFCGRAAGPAQAAGLKRRVTESEAKDQAREEGLRDHTPEFRERVAAIFLATAA